MVHGHTCLFILPIPPWSQCQRDMALDLKLPHHLKHISPVSSALYPVFISLFPLAVSLQLCSFLFRGTLILHLSLVPTTLSLYLNWQASSNDGLHKLCPLPLLLIKTSTPCWLSSTLSLFFTALANVTYGLPLVVQCVVFSPYFTVYLSVLFGTIDSCLPPETSSSSSFQNHIFSIFLAILMKSFSSNHIFLYSVPWKQTVG